MTQYSELLSSMKWYFELKNLSLKKILSFRIPLSVEDQNDVRLYYSQYFSALLSATELFLEDKYAYKDNFKKKLFHQLSFENFTNGKANYDYLRELRNSIIHRGLNINSSAHIQDDFPMIIAPSPITNRGGNISYLAFDYYLIDLIKKCESILGPTFLEHIEECKIFEMQMTNEEAIRHSKQDILNSTAMPDWVKNMALNTIEDINHEEIYLVSINNLKKILQTNILTLVKT